MAKLIGHSDASFLNYDSQGSIWNIVKNPQMEHAANGNKKRGAEAKSKKTKAKQQKGPVKDSDEGEARVQLEPIDQNEVEERDYHSRKLSYSSHAYSR